MKKSILFLIGSLMLFISHGQQSLRPAGDIVAPSPNIAAINKYIDMPVSHYTGLPDIEVPLFTISMKQFSLPISLNYHASGLKVSDHASWIGAGWSLNAGGNISRVVRGLPDEFAEGDRLGFFHNSQYFNDQGNWYPYATNCSDDPEAEGGPGVLEFIEEGKKDFEPDLFYFSAPGLSGKFLFNSSRKPIFLSQNDITLMHPYTTAANGQANYPKVGDLEWSIIGPDGVSYTFERPEYTSTLTECDPSGIEQNKWEQIQSTWYLTKISIGSEYIDFAYAEEEVVYEDIYSQSQQFQVYDLSTVVSTGFTPQASFCKIKRTIKTQRLESIVASNGYSVIFHPSQSDRRDQKGSKALESIVINKNNQAILRYGLNQTYFGTGEYKLKLDGIDQLALDDSKKRIHLQEFDYYDEAQVPELQSFSQDYYGYYNGRNNSTLIPDWRDKAHHYNPNGADRSIDLEKTKVGTLRRITYQTGGYREFDYELHDISDTTFRHTVKLEDFIEEGTIGNPIAKISEEFMVEDTAYMSLFMSMPILDEDLNDISGIDYGVYIEKHDVESGDWLVHRPELSQPTMSTAISLNEVKLGANRFVLPSGNYRLRALSMGGGLDYKATIDEYKDVDFYKIGGLRVRQITSYDHVKGTYLHDFYEYTTGTDGNKKSSGLVFTAPETAGYFTDHFRHDTSFEGDDGPTDLWIDQDGIPVDPEEVNESVSTTDVIRLIGSYIFTDLNDEAIIRTKGDFSIVNSDPTDEEKNDEGQDLFSHFRNLAELGQCNINTISRYLNLSSSSTLPIATFSGSHIGYTAVQQYQIRDEDTKRNDFYIPTHINWPLNARINSAVKINGIIEYHFINEAPSQPQTAPYVPASDLSYKNGKTDRVRAYEFVNDALVLRSETTNNYVDAGIDRDFSVIGLKIIKLIHDECYLKCRTTNYAYNYYVYATNWNYLSETVTRSYEDNGQISSAVTYHYDTDEIHHYPIRNETIDSKGNSIKTFINRALSTPALIESQEVFINEKQISGERLYYSGKQPTLYESWNREFPQNGATNEPSTNGEYRQLQLLKYDSAGNLKESILLPKEEEEITESLTMSFLWKNELDLLAKFSNVTYEEIIDYIEDLGVSKATFLNSESDQEQRLRAIQRRLRPDQKMQIFIHDSPFGPSKIIDENGKASYYQYDEFGRLSSILDEEGNVLSHQEYHYVKQNF